MNLWYLPEGLLREMFTSVKSLAAIQATKVSFRLMHFFATEQTCGFSSAPLHFTSCIQPICANSMVPCTIHRTATGAGDATSHPVPLPLSKGGKLRGGGKHPNSHQRK